MRRPAPPPAYPALQVPDLPPGGDHPHCRERCGRTQRVFEVPPHTLHGPRGPQGKLPTLAYFSLFLPCLFTYPPGPGHIPHHVQQQTGPMCILKHMPRWIKSNIQCLLCGRHITYTNLFNLHKTSVKWVLVSSPVYT